MNIMGVVRTVHNSFLKKTTQYDTIAKSNFVKDSKIQNKVKKINAYTAYATKFDHNYRDHSF